MTDEVIMCEECKKRVAKYVGKDGRDLCKKCEHDEIDDETDVEVCSRFRI